MYQLSRSYSNIFIRNGIVGILLAPALKYFGAENWFFYSRNHHNCILCMDRT